MRDDRERPYPAGGEAAPPRARTELRARRRRITRALLGGLAALGAVAYVPSVWAGVAVGVWWIVILDTVVYAVILAAFFWPGLSDAVRAGAMVGVAAVLGVTLSVGFGPNGAGALWIAAVPVLTALLFERRGTLWSLAFMVAALGVVAALRWADLLAWDITPGGTLLWVLISGNVVLVSGALALAVTALIGGLTEAADRTERYGAALAREQAELLEAHDRLERAIAERSRAEARLRQAEKMTAIGTLASGIAHDMNNLLVPILSGAQLLRAEEKDDGGARAEILDRTLGAARAARDLVDRVLAFSRPGGEDREPLAAALVFREAARLLQAALPPEIELAFRADPDTGAVVLSNAEAHQLVLNLGTNGAQAMPAGGKLLIEVDPIPAGDQPGDVPVPDSGRFVRLMVTDLGVGMDEQTLARIFEPFFSRRDRSASGAGHGIGLATVYGIVSSAGGFIVPHSRPGAGTVMEVFLPMVEPARISPRPTPASSPRAAGQRVLVVDDEPDVRVMATRILERAGYRVTAVECAEDALRRIGGGESFAVVLTDVAMPGMDGLELTALLRERSPELPVLVMSGLADEALRERCAGLDVDGVVSKPFDLEDLVLSVGAALGGRVSNGPG